MRPGAAAERVGRSGGPTQPESGESGAGESVGRVTRVGSVGESGPREGRSVGYPASVPSGRDKSVGQYMYFSSILTPKSKMAVTHITSHAPQRAAAWVGRSGGPSRDGRRCRRPGGSVGRAPRTPICFSALCAAGRSVWTCRVGNRSFYYRGSVGRDARFTFNFAPPNLVDRSTLSARSVTF